MERRLLLDVGRPHPTCKFQMDEGHGTRRELALVCLSASCRHVHLVGSPGGSLTIWLFSLSSQWRLGTSRFYRHVPCPRSGPLAGCSAQIAPDIRPPKQWSDIWIPTYRNLVLCPSTFVTPSLCIDGKTLTPLCLRKDAKDCHTSGRWHSEGARLPCDWARVINQCKNQYGTEMSDEIIAAQTYFEAFQENLADGMMFAETLAQVVRLEEADKQDSLEPATSLQHGIQLDSQSHAQGHRRIQGDPVALVLLLFGLPFSLCSTHGTFLCPWNCRVGKGGRKPLKKTLVWGSF